MSTNTLDLATLVTERDHVDDLPELVPSRSAGPQLVCERSGAGPALVLLHGLGESAVGWRPVQEALSDRFDVIAVDLPGFAGSPELPAQVAPTASALADAVERHLDGLGVGQFHVAGYSLGARIALELAGRGRVLSVVAIAPDGLGTAPERMFQALALTAGRAVAAFLAPVATALTATAPGRSVFFALERSRPWNLDPHQARDLLLSFAHSPGYMAAVGAGIFDFPAGLNQITCPVLILVGTADPVMCLQSPRFLAFVPHAQLRWLPGLSHVPISDDPALVSRFMLDFLGAAQ